jgi:hypothetical protein
MEGRKEGRKVAIMECRLRRQEGKLIGGRLGNN